VDSTKNGINLGDGHCGHLFGLTPPKHWVSDTNSDLTKVRKFQEISWNWLLNIGLLDFVNYNGDMIEGKGIKSGGRELGTSDRNRQVEVACEVDSYISKHCGNPKRYVIFGTPYHTGTEEDWEYTFAKDIDAEECGGHLWISVNGVVFDFKHFIGTSQVPYGRSTAINREQIWNVLWSEKDLCPKSDVLIRNHGHYYEYSGRENVVGIICPGMEGKTIFGETKCTGLVDYGFLKLQVTGDRRFTWEPHLLRLNFSKPEVHIV
jgi:hypothetical protein